MQLTPHFTDEEMKCHCGRVECDAVPMDFRFLAMLEDLRVDWGKPLSPTSARRCVYWNQKQGGAPNSMHLKGRAVDFWFQKTHELIQFLILVEKHGFGGVGHGHHLLHIDNGPAGRRWSYRD